MFPDSKMTLLDGQRALEKLISDLEILKHDWSEAQTRFQIIDRLIIECFGWPRSQLTLESHSEGDYADYELGNPRTIIWEAKRVGKVFELPANPRQKIISDLRSVCQLSPEAKDAIEQVQKYCSRRGVDLAVVTNGNQIIAFLATRDDGVSPLDGKCLLIYSLSHLQKEFPKIWQALSPDGIAEKKLKNYLRLGESEKLPDKISNSVVGYPKFREPSKLQKDLQIISNLLLIDIEEWEDAEAKFYTNCYCTDRTLSKYSLISKEILESRYAGLFPENERSPSLDPISKKTLNALVSDEKVLAQSLSQRPIVLLGDVGVGKTAFLKNLIFVSAESQFSNSVYIYIDLSSKGTLSDNLHTFILDEIESQMYSRYKIDLRNNTFLEKIYDSDLARFEKGIFGSLKNRDPMLFERKKIEFIHEKIERRDKHIESSIRYIRTTTGRQFIIVLDNADQRAVEIQVEACAISREIAKQWDALVFLSMRPQTFSQIARDAGIVADTQRVFTITPPRIEEAILRRLQFALGIAEGQIEIPRLQGIELDLISFSAVCEALSSGLRQKGSQLVRFLTNFFDGNVADAVQATSNFFGNPNVNERRIIGLARRGINPVATFNDFWPSVVQGQFSYFSPNTSRLLNVFDVFGADPKEHFLLPMVLALLREGLSQQGTEGFLEFGFIIGEMQDWGFSSRACERIVDLAAGKDKPLISRALGQRGHNGVHCHYRITSVGSYYLTILAEFRYLEAMSWDTPIFDSDSQKTIADLAADLSIHARMRRALIFRSYLTNSWKEAGLRPKYFDWYGHVNEWSAAFEQLGAAIHDRDHR